MTPVSRNLPRVYTLPLAPDRQRLEPRGLSGAQTSPDSERIIEAEWRPISGPAYVTNVYQTRSTIFLTEESTPPSSESPEQAAARYHDMTAKPPMPRGTLVDIQA